MNERGAKRVPTNPEGIKSFSPALAMQSPTLGNGAMKSSTLKGLNGVTTAAGAGDATPLGLGIIIGTVTQGSPALRANPGLSDGIPLGF